MVLAQVRTLRILGDICEELGMFADAQTYRSEEEKRMKDVLAAADEAVDEVC